jgi:hypothetical protein
LSKLVSARVTIRNFEAPEQVWAELGEQIFSAAVQLAEQTSMRNANAEVELIDGSLRAATSLFGAMLIGYGVIADYKGFKESLVEIGQDTRRFGTAIREVIPQIVRDKHRIGPHDVRKGKIVVTAEEISKLIERLEKLKVQSQTMNEAELSAELDKVARGFKFLRKQLDQKDREVVERYLAEGDLPVPGVPRLPVRDESKAILRPDSFEELRRRIEEAELDRPLAMHPPRADVAPVRRRRRMYFKRAPVRAVESTTRLP